MLKLIRTSTVPLSLSFLLKGQLRFLNQYYHVIGVSSAGEDLNIVKEREGIEVHAINMERQVNLTKDIVSLWKLYRLFKRVNPDIVHSITPKAGLLSMVAARLAGVPIRIHTFTGLIFPYKKGLFQKILISMDRLLCCCATHIFPEGEGVRNDLINYHITPKKLKIIANGNVNGINTSFFSPDLYSDTQNKQLRQELSIVEDDFVFIFIGRLVRDKGINELIEVFYQLSEQYSSIKLLLVGPFESELDPLDGKTLEIINSNTSIIHVGFQSDVRPYFAISNALAFPSYREGFPNVVMQAGAMGLPSIVTDINGCNEIVIDGCNGTIIPAHNAMALKNAMVQYISDRQLVERLQDKARQMITSRYEQIVVWKALLDEYQSIEHNHMK